MKVQTTTGSTLPVQNSSTFIKSNQDSTFAKLMDEAMKLNADFNLDYSVTKSFVSHSAPSLELGNGTSSQELQPIDISAWLDLQSQIQSSSVQFQANKSSSNNLQVGFSELKYIDANGKPTKDVNLALEAANNALDTKIDELLGFNDKDFEFGNKLYGQNKAEQIASWYANPLNKEKLQNEVNQVLAKFGLPEEYQKIIPRGMIKPVVDREIALAGRQTLTPEYSKFPDNPSGRALALETWQTSSKYYVNPMDFTSLDDYKNAQMASELNKLNNEVQCYKNFGVDVLKDEAGGLPSRHNLSLSRLKAQQGLGAGEDVQVKASWFGVTEENYHKALQGDSRATKLESPIQRLASEVARAASVLKPDELKKQYPKVFNEGGLAVRYPEILSLYKVLSNKKNNTRGLVEIL